MQPYSAIWYRPDTPKRRSRERAPILVNPVVAAQLLAELKHSNAEFVPLEHVLGQGVQSWASPILQTDFDGSHAEVGVLSARCWAR